MYFGNISVWNILTTSLSRLNLIRNVLARLMPCWLCPAMSHVSSIWMISHVSSSLSLIRHVLACPVSRHLCLGKYLCLGKMSRLHHCIGQIKAVMWHATATTTTILWPLHRLSCVSWHPQLRTKGSCWSKMLLPAYPYQRQLAHSN